MIAETNAVAVALSASERKIINQRLPGEESPAKFKIFQDRPSEKIFVDEKIGFEKLNIFKVDYQVDHETKEITIRVIEPETGKIIRPISGEDLLPFVSRSQRFSQNLLDTLV